MTTLSILLGVALLLFTLFDVFATVFVIGGGAGPQSGLAADRLWRLALKVHRPDSKRSHSMLRIVGPLIVLLALATWTIELILGWALIFVPAVFKDPAAVSFQDRLLFGAHSIIGRSGNSPALEVDAAAWETVHALSGLTGVVIVSVGLAYVLPIISAVAQKRAVAALIHSLGDSADSMIELGTVEEENSFKDHLIQFIPEIALTAERHRSYPVLHYFHSDDPHAALAPALAKLALTLKSDTSKMPKVNKTVTRPLVHMIHSVMDALSELGLERFAKQEDDIDAAKLDKLNIDPRNPPPADRMPNTEWFKAYVGFDGWRWEAIVEGAQEARDAEGNRLVKRMEG